METNPNPKGPLGRKRITQIQVFVEGQEKPLVIEGALLEDPLGGILAWNDFAIHQLVAPFYDRTRAHDLTGLDVIRWWHGSSSRLGLEQAEVPPFMVRPICEPRFPPE